MTFLRFYSQVKGLSYAALSLLLFNTAATYGATSQIPLSLTVGVPPNMLLTLDDSGSMRWAFAPDDKNDTWRDRKSKSNTYNPIYYNPEATYVAPTVASATGTGITLSSSFTDAPVNGYNLSRGTLNLSNNYKVSWAYVLEGGIGSSYGYNFTSTSLAENPRADFSCSVSNLNSGEEKQCTIANNRTVTIRRGWQNNCTASTSGWANGDCYYDNGTYTGSWTRVGVPAYYYTYNSSTTGCTTGVDNCYTLRFVTTAEQQNFANWYSFYRNRALATISAAALAFYDLSPAVRLSWQGLGRCASFDGTDSNCKNNAFKAYSPEHKGQLYSWLQNINFDQSTYLPRAMKRAGSFLATETPWKFDPAGSGNTTQNTYACRPSYHIMMTDGQWNESVSGPSNFRHDSANFSLPDGTNYSNRTPFYDEQNNTLADLAMHYWATDLNTSLANKVPAYMPSKNDDATVAYWDTRNDPATWQHMINFMMGLGLTESLDRTNIPWEGNTHSGAGYNALLSGSATWPPASASGANNNVYDLWHAAINSRGEFFSVDSPDAMVQAFQDVLSRIAERKASAARPAISSGVIVDDSLRSISYQTSYASDENWSGDLKRFSKKLVDTVNEDGTTTTTLVNSQDWSAKEKLPAAGSRNIKIAADGTAGETGLKDFSSSNAGDVSIGGSLAYELSDNPEISGHDDDGRGADRLAYIRGDRGNEGSDIADFRPRTSVLGDLYGSSPVTVSGPRYLEHFANRLEGHVSTDANSYSAFADQISGETKRTGRIYVGGNDGMLHGFNSETGVEEFAFIPTAVFPKLSKLTDKKYSHEFYVDGSPVVADVFDGSNWRTILVGTLRAGGKALFALDITTPGAEKLLWEFDLADTEGETDVAPGYSFSRPTIARLHTGKWAVVTGNGYENGSTDGKAALYIIDAIDGTLTRSLDVEGTAGTANGLSSPTLADYNADGIADYAYAGDLQGNLWRFDLLPTTNSDADGDGILDAATPFATDTIGTVAPTAFKVAYGGAPMFKAVASNGATQPITAAPTLIRHPGRVGYLVVFGTGKFFEDADKAGDKSHAQSIYGIWDAKTKAENTTALSINEGNPINRSNLVQQTITNSVTGTYSNGDTNEARIVSNESILWTSSSVDGVTTILKYGWYLDLKAADQAFDGEMLVENMTALGQTVFFQTLVPNDDPCADGTSNWTYAINPSTGGRTQHHAFDLRQVVDGKSNVVTGIKQDGEGGITIAQRPNGDFELCTGQECQKIHPDPSSLGRQSWRVVGN